MKIFKRKSMLKILTLIFALSLLFTIVGCTGNTDTEDDISVTSITITSVGSMTTITEHAGTLQLKATIVPTNATNKLVTWMITDGTGSATITDLGVVTAQTDGTVTAKAVSKSDTSKYAEFVITITNQVMDNKEPLATEVATSSRNLDDTMVGTAASQFVSSVEWVLASDHDQYLTAISAAETTLAMTSLTDLEVTAAVNLLEQATATFNASKQNGTKIVENINLGTAENFVILSKSGISTTGVTAITGDIGVSPVSASYITGFGLIMDSGNEFSTSSLITGQVYASDYQFGTPALLTTAIADMATAYTEGAGRTADYNELYTGDLSGKTLYSGVYKWGNEVLINTDLTLDGSSTDVFIFQIAGTLTMAANTMITLTGGVLPENVYWVVADTVAIGVGSDFQGIILSMTNVSMNTGSTIIGMIYAQTDVSLDATTVTKP